MPKKEHIDKRIQHHLDNANHHADMADKGINKEFHLKQEAYHRKLADKLAKDIGPIVTTGGSIPNP